MFAIFVQSNFVPDGEKNALLIDFPYCHEEIAFILLPVEEPMLRMSHRRTVLSNPEVANVVPLGCRLLNQKIERYHNEALYDINILRLRRYKAAQTIAAPLT